MLYALEAKNCYFTYTYGERSNISQGIPFPKFARRKPKTPPVARKTGTGCQYCQVALTHAWQYFAVSYSNDVSPDSAA
jgi:hypothetical protein